jgi:hypothetical protein
MMLQHPELIWWKKCATCGFSAIPYDEMSEENKAKAKAKPFTRHLSVEAGLQIEAEQKERRMTALQCRATSLSKEYDRQESEPQTPDLQLASKYRNY